MFQLQKSWLTEEIKSTTLKGMKPDLHAVDDGTLEGRTSADADTRLVVVSTRAAHREVYRCTGFEFEDVAVGVADTTLVSPCVAVPAADRRLRIARALQRLSAGRFQPRLYATESAPPAEPADVVVVYAQFPADVDVVLALGDLRRWGRRAVCFIEEVYIAHLDKWQGVLPLLDHFDHLWVSNEETVDAWRPRLGVPVAYLPFSVDALRFAPRAPGGDRPIAVMNIGRRSAVTHEALVAWAAEACHLYYFDTFGVGKVCNHAQHRWLMANLLQRSRIAISNRGVGANPNRTNWQASVPTRFFEAAAAGAVLLGVAPNLPGMAANFGWPDAHLPMAFDEPDAGAVVNALLAQPERLAAASRRNVVESLRRHDHLYRLATMLAAVDVPLGPAARSRHKALRARAALHDLHSTADRGS